MSTPIQFSGIYQLKLDAKSKKRLYQHPKQLDALLEKVRRHHDFRGLKAQALIAESSPPRADKLGLRSDLVILTDDEHGKDSTLYATYVKSFKNHVGPQQRKPKALSWFELLDFRTYCRLKHQAPQAVKPDTFRAYRAENKAELVKTRFKPIFELPISIIFKRIGQIITLNFQEEVEKTATAA